MNLRSAGLLDNGSSGCQCQRKDQHGEDVVDLTGGHPRAGANFFEENQVASRRLLADGKSFSQHTHRYV